MAGNPSRRCTRLIVLVVPLAVWGCQTASLYHHQVVDTLTLHDAREIGTAREQIFSSATRGSPVPDSSIAIIASGYHADERDAAAFASALLRLDQRGIEWYEPYKGHRLPPAEVAAVEDGFRRDIEAVRQAHLRLIGADATRRSALTTWYDAMLAVVVEDDRVDKR
jgi:hypothetical protein